MSEIFGNAAHQDAVACPLHASRDTTPSSPHKRIHTERGYPLVGALFPILRDALRFFLRIAQEHPSEIVGVRLGPVTVYLVSHPDHVQHVLVDHWRNFSKGGMWKGARPLLGDGLASSDGDIWARQRRLMQPVFKPSHLASLADVMVDVIDQEMVRLAQQGDDSVVDMDKEMLALVQRVVLRTMLGMSLTPRENARLVEHLRVALQWTGLRMFLYFLPERFPLPSDRAARKALAAIDEAMLRTVRLRRESGKSGNDLLSLLMIARDEGAWEGMDDRQLRDELVTIFVTGSDTTAHTMTWLFYELDRNPDVDRKLRTEVAEVLGGRRPTCADLGRLVYTRQVIQEILRLYPGAWMIPRFTVKDEIIDGCLIPAGSPIMVLPLASHRDPAFWPEPERFDPERFCPDQVAKRPHFAYYPFGGGPRVCIGSVFSTMEAQIITAMMVQRFRPRLVPGHRVVVTSAAALLKPRYGLKMTLRRADAAGVSAMP